MVRPEGIEPPTFGFVERWRHVSPYHLKSRAVKNRQYSCVRTHALASCVVSVSDGERGEMSAELQRNFNIEPRAERRLRRAEPRGGPARARRPATRARRSPGRRR